ncbi:MAG: 16S rRNA (cytidine(1402)-2'-O)-methyltransferase [Oscillospiraceae bacterium]|nr:16S rRNA (cytidine(1402)-2'-O)-methyltransferase [Oscillospiraceae bacterium]
MKGKLYVVGTPIGNLSDASDRMKKILSEVDFIAAEDTRVTLKLLNKFGIKKPLITYFEHNIKLRGAEIVERILKGETCAITTDAGMPCISDPGEDLVRQCAENGIETIVVPGPTAFASALCVSGLPTGRFCFEGFLSVNQVSRREHLNSLLDETRTMIFYEAPHKLKRTISDMAKYFGGERRVAIVRELTKIHETVLRITLSEAVAFYKENEPIGEYVIVLEGKREEKKEVSIEEAVEYARRLVEEGEMKTEAAKKAAKKSGFSKSEIYKQLN